MTAAILFAVLSALCNACSAVLQRLAVSGRVAEKKSAWRTAIDLVRQPMWLLGGLFLVGTFGFQALALYFGPLAVVQPVLVLELIFTLGFRAFLLHDDIAARTWSAALMICVGLAAFLVAASPTEGTHVPDAGQWIVAVGSRALIVAVLLLLSRRGSPAAPPSSARPRPSCGRWTPRSSSRRWTCWPAAACSGCSSTGRSTP